MILKERQSCSVQKTTRENTKYSTNKRIVKIGHLRQRLQLMHRPLQNSQFGSKIVKAKNMGKTILQKHQSCSVQKSARKNTKYSKNERSLKISHLRLRLQPMQRVQTLQNRQFGSKIKKLKTCERQFYTNIKVALCKKPLQKKTQIFDR